MRLSHVLFAKIVVTAIFWCVPLLVSPAGLYAALGIPLPVPILFSRLLGAAYLALMVVYWCGWKDARAGRRPRVAVRAGVVSNGVAAILLAVHGAAGDWNDWGRAGQAYMWASLAAAASLTVGLLVARRDHATRSDAADSREVRADGCRRRASRTPRQLLQETGKHARLSATWFSDAMPLSDDLSMLGGALHATSAHQFRFIV